MNAWGYEIPERYSPIKMYREIPLKWVIFNKKSLNMSSIFYKNIPKHGSVFLKFSKFVKNGPIF